jgi:hypothetical protein
LRKEFFQNLKQNKNDDKERVFNAMEDPDNAKVIIDCSFSEHMGL